MDTIIYLIKNLINGKCYVGQTMLGLEQRKKEHLRLAKSGSGFYFHNALRKYGEENFEWSILTQATNINELNTLETDYIEKLGTLAPNGYNLTTGGKNCQASDETKDKMSAAQTGEGNGMYGKEHTYEARRKISEGNGHCKLTVKQVLAIKEGLKDKTSQRTLAKKFNISIQTISHINTGISWGTLNSQPSI